MSSALSYATVAPSIGMAAPDTRDASSDTRNSARLAISGGCEKRPLGMRLGMRARRSSLSTLAFLVSSGRRWKVRVMGLSMADANFAAIVMKPDNVPIVGLVFLLAFFTWVATKQAVVNDDRIALTHLHPPRDRAMRIQPRGPKRRRQRLRVSTLQPPRRLKRRPGFVMKRVNVERTHFNSASFLAASALALVMTLSSVTLAPFWRLLSSAASMKA